MKDKEVKFKAILSGDNECFTFAVDKENYIAVTGYKPPNFSKNHLIKNRFNLYLEDIFIIDKALPPIGEIEITIKFKKEK